MIISRDRKIAGAPAVEVREAMRWLDNIAATRTAVARRFPVVGTRAVFEQLVEEGYVRRIPDGVNINMLMESTSSSAKRDDHWTTTVQGTQLAKARIGKRIARAKADTLLAAFMERVEVINTDPAGLFWIDVVEVFGSYASGDGEVGDIDLRVLACGRFDRNEQIEREAAAAERSGRRFNTLIDRLGYAQMQLLRDLKARSQYLDIQLDFEHPGALPEGTRTTVVYEREPSS